MIRSDALKIYRWIRTARRIDATERELVARGEAFFQVSSAGHEATAALAPMLQPDDFLHCHYRDKALLLARGLPIIEFFNSLLCNSASHSAGRQMSAHFSAASLNILSMVGPVGNNALQAVGIAHEIKARPSRPIVLCAAGDGTTQQGEFLEAIAEAVRWQLPVLFLIEDNHYSISTRTKGKTFFSGPTGDADSFYGLPISRVDGSDPLACVDAFGAIVAEIRTTRGPALCVMQTQRLTDHTNADDETAYRDADEILQARANADPLEAMRRRLLQDGLTAAQIQDLDDDIDGEVAAACDLALTFDAPLTSFDARMPLPAVISLKADYRGTADDRSVTMGGALRKALQENMRGDPRVTLYGQDIEDPKGDVFGLTRGLTVAFPGRVANSPLSESTIIGTSIGRALAGGRPVAFIQFADFLPLAFNQLASELGSMAWRTNGSWTSPVVVMVPCGGYRPGLGPFHASTFESLVAHIPGIDVAMPSTAADAAGILNAAFLSERPTVLFYPKALLNDQARTTSPDIDRHFVGVGRALTVRAGHEITLVAWGNTVPICEQVAATLASAGVEADVIDLRWISPWDREAVCASVRKTRRLIVVHEDSQTAGFGAEIIATVSEAVEYKIQSRRVARPDTYVPCHFGNQLDVLPSYRSVLEAAADMCDLDLTWEAPPQPDAQRFIVRAIGSSPADQTVQLAELMVKGGDLIKVGQTIASLEADKAVVEIASPAEGLVEEIHLRIGERTAVDQPLMTLRLLTASRRQQKTEAIGTPHLVRHAPAAAAISPSHQSAPILLAGLAAVEGKSSLTNDALFGRLPTLAADRSDGDGILDRTGIESRLVAADTQTVASMAADAARQVLKTLGLEPGDIDLVICSTSSPAMISPSTASQVLHLLAPTLNIAAYDIQAACSGYLYALANAWDYLQTRPDHKVLVLTSELMRGIVDIDDPNTSPIFGDAATATVVSTAAGSLKGIARLHRPVISGRAEGGATLRVPLPAPGAYVHMDGGKIFSEAVRRMDAMLELACTEMDISARDLDLIVPHQANGRIIEALCRRLKLPPERVWNEIRFKGNTSSSSIPLALTSLLGEGSAKRRMGLCAFGAGYTFAGAVIDTV